MTKNEFYNLHKGDTVNLPFSSNPVQKVSCVDVDKMMIHTYSESFPGLEYVNRYDDIEFVSHYNAEAERKNKEVRNHIVGLFNSFKSDTCPFKTECDAMYSEVRKHSTSTFSLCDVIKNRINNY